MTSAIKKRMIPGFVVRCLGRGALEIERSTFKNAYAGGKPGNPAGPQVFQRYPDCQCLEKNRWIL
jgi:hypothetical protein